MIRVAPMPLPNDRTPAEVAAALERADAALASPDEDTRWQAAIALGQFCETHPTAIWPLVEKWGSSDDEDTRTAIATCVLEHVLECHFEPFFARTAKLIRQGNVLFADTFCGCWRLGQANESANAAKFDRLETEARRLLRKANLKPEAI